MKKNKITKLFIKKKIIMGCGCKGKKAVAPSQQTARIAYVENGEVKTRPAPSPVAPPQQVENIINKLNEITQES